MSIDKYFWDLNTQAIRNTIQEIFKNPDHTKFISRMTILLSRCDDPKEVFKYINRSDFINYWPSIRKYWKKTSKAIDFLAWWETIFESLVKKEKPDIPSEILQNIGNNIKSIRHETGYSQQDISNLAGISQADISRIENGQLNMKILSLLKILKALKINDFNINLNRK